MIISTLPKFGPADVLTLAEVPAPVPGEHEVLIRVEAAGVNRADLLQREGRYPAPEGAPEWLGLEVAGVVAQVGMAVRGWSVGDRVCALLAGGGYAEFATVHEDLVLPVPAGLTSIEAAGLVEAACTAWSNFRAADAVAGQSVLVHGGSGGVGHVAIQMAVAMGLEVVTTAGGAERAQRCRDLGAVAIDYRTQDFAEVVAARGGVDIILDVVGAAYLERNLAALRTGGTLVVIGLQRGARAELDLSVLLTRRASVVGTTLRSRPHAQKAAIVAGVREQVWPWVPAQVRPHIHATFPLAGAGDAHRALESGEVFGKVVLTVGD